MFFMGSVDEGNVKVVHSERCSDSVGGPCSKQKGRSLHCNRRPVCPCSAEASLRSYHLRHPCERSLLRNQTDEQSGHDSCAAGPDVQSSRARRHDGASDRPCSRRFGVNASLPPRFAPPLVQLIQTGPIQSESKCKDPPSEGRHWRSLWRRASASRVIGPAASLFRILNRGSHTSQQW